MATEYASDEGELDIFFSPIDHDVSAPITPIPAPDESNTPAPDLNTHLRLRFFGLLDEAVEYLQKFSLTQGFAVSLKRSKPKAEVFYYKCDRGGAYRDRVIPGARRCQ